MKEFAKGEKVQNIDILHQCFSEFGVIVEIFVESPYKEWYESYYSQIESPVNICYGVHYDDDSDDAWLTYTEENQLIKG